MSRPPTYNHLQVELTSRCNLRCRTCLYGHYPERWVANDLSAEILDRALEAAPRIRSVHLQGWGESLLREDCAAVIARVKQTGPSFSLSSNGSMMTPDLARDLIAAGLDSLAFSFAGTSAAEQDSLRGAGSFQQAAASAALFAASRRGVHPPVLMNYLLMRSNRQSLSRTLRLAGRLGMDRVEVGHFIHCVSPVQAEWPSYPEAVAGRPAMIRAAPVRSLAPNEPGVAVREGAAHGDMPEKPAGESVCRRRWNGFTLRISEPAFKNRHSPIQGRPARGGPQTHHGPA